MNGLTAEWQFDHLLIRSIGISEQLPIAATFELQNDAGDSLSYLARLGTWWASILKERWPDHDGARTYLAAHLQEPWCERRHKIVFIHAGIDWHLLREKRDAALIPAAGSLADLDDPFPVWDRAEEAA